jgi:hypothetical protein
MICVQATVRLFTRDAYLPWLLTEARVFSGKEHRDGINAGQWNNRTISAGEISVPGLFQPQFEF